MPSSMSAEEELEVARSIRLVERELLAVLENFRELPVVAAALDGVEGRTHKAQVKRQRAAVKAVRGLAGARARVVAGLWDQAENERWRLAMSCAHIARKEGEKKAGMMTAEDLEVEGQIGLYEAALRFDADRGLRFGTYAKWWVRMAITRAIDEQGRTIRITGNVVERRRNLHKLVAELDRRGEDYTVDDLAEFLGITVESVTEALGVPVDGVPIVTSSTMEDSAGSDRSQQVDLEDDDVDILEDVEKSLQRRWLWWALAQLAPRDRLILRMMHGFDRTRRQHSLQEVADQLGISRERVRVLKNRALERVGSLPKTPQPRCPPVVVEDLDASTAHVLDQVWHGSRTSQELAEATGLGKGTILRSLRELRARGLVEVNPRWEYDVRGGRL